MISNNGPGNLKKYSPKKLLKSNKSIIQNFILTKFNFLQFQKWPKINFWTVKKLKTDINSISRNFLLNFHEKYDKKFFVKLNFIELIFFSGENPAAMQTGTSHRMQSTAPLFWVFLLLTCTQYLLHRAHFETTASIVSRSASTSAIRLPNLFSLGSSRRWIWGHG